MKTCILETIVDTVSFVNGGFGNEIPSACHADGSDLPASAEAEALRSVKREREDVRLDCCLCPAPGFVGRVKVLTRLNHPKDEMKQFPHHCSQCLFLVQTAFE
jgi:hypothetical protein